MLNAKANWLHSSQPALRDRMEIIEVSDLSEEEKLQIAKKHLVPNQRKDHGIKSNQFRMSDAVIKKIIREYTRESGVRNLNREIAGVMRHAAKEIAMENKEKISIRIKDLEEILGPGKFSRDEIGRAHV